MTYKLNGKSIRIPDDDIQRTMKSFGVTKDEAIQVWLEDEGYLENEEQEALEKKAKENKILSTIHQAESKAKVEKKKAQARGEKKETQSRKKEDPTKENIIKQIAGSLEGLANDIQILNPTKLIQFKIGNDVFKLDLSRTNLKLQEKKKKGAEKK